MSEADLRPLGEGRWELVGTLDFQSVPTVWPALEAELRGGAGLSLSLAGVERANSAALAMLMEARDVAVRRGCRLSLTDVPQALLDLASMSQCGDLLLADAA